MLAVAVVTVIGLTWSVFHPKVLEVVPSFLKGIFVPTWPPPRPWDPKDATKLLTAITFAGLGGFWTLFYSYWLREKGSGMGRYIGHITGVLGKKEPISHSGFILSEDATSLKELPKWRRFLLIDSGIGIFGNIATTLLTCLLAYALLHPEGLLPEEYELAVVQSRFFEVSWGAVGKILFLCVAAAFLSDTWLTTVDAVSRIHTECVYSFFTHARRFTYRSWYYFFLVLLTVITSITVLFDAPGPLILTSAVIGFLGTVIFSIAILFLNHFYLVKYLPRQAHLGRGAMFWMGVTCLAYLLLAAFYLLVRFGSKGVPGTP